MADHNEFGKIAEDLAVDFLVKAEYKILARNFRYLKAEIDIRRLQLLGDLDQI